MALRHKAVTYQAVLLSGFEGQLTRCSCGYRPDASRNFAGPIGTEVGYKKHVKAVWRARLEAVTLLFRLGITVEFMWSAAKAAHHQEWDKATLYVVCGFVYTYAMDRMDRMAND